MKAEFAVATDRIDCTVAVLGRPVFGIRVKVEEHVVDVVLEIDVVLHLIVNAIVGDITVEKTGHGIPTRPGFTYDVVLVHPPVLFPASEVFGIPIVFNSLGQIVDAKVKSIVIEVNKSAMSAGMAQISHALLHPNITGVLRIIRAIAAAAPSV